MAENIRLLIDTSGSMKESDQARLRRPGMHLLLSLLALDGRHQVGVRAFTERTLELIPSRPLTTDTINQVLSGLSWPADDGGTVLSYGVAEVLAEQPPPRDLIVLSDAQFEKAEAETLLGQAEKLRAANIRFSAIGLSAAPENTLLEMAKLTGGVYFNLDTRAPKTPSDWETAILRLVFHLYPPNLYVVSGSRGLPVNRLARRGVFIAPHRCTITAPDGKVVCDAGTLRVFPPGQIIPNDKWTILAVRQEGQDLEGYWQFVDEAGHPVSAAFVGDSAVELALRGAVPANVAGDDVVQMPMEVSLDAAAVQKMAAEALKGFFLEVATYGQTGAWTRVVSQPLALGEAPQRANVALSFWPVSGPAELELAVRHPDLPGLVASRRIPLMVGPPRFVYEFQSLPRQGGAPSWQVASPRERLLTRQDHYARFRIKPSGPAAGAIRLEGSVRLLAGGRVLQEQPLTVVGTDLLASLDPTSAPPGLYEVEVTLTGTEAVQGAVPVFDVVGSGSSKLQSKAVFELQVAGLPVQPLVVTAALDVPVSLRQGVPLRGVYRARVSGGTAAERAAAAAELSQRPPPVQMEFSGPGKGRSIDVTIGPLIEKRGGADFRELESAFEARGCQYLGRYVMHVGALALPHTKRGVAEKQAALEVTPGLVQCAVLRDNGVSPSRGLLDSLQPSFQDIGEAFVGDEIFLELRRSATCEPNLFLALHGALQLWFIQNGVAERIPLELKGDKYVSRKSRLEHAGKFEFRAAIPIGGEEFELRGRAGIIEPVVKLEVAPPEHFPSVVPEGALLPLSVKVSVEAGDAQDAEAILRRCVLCCEVLDSRGELLTKQPGLIRAPGSDWRPVVCLARRGQLKVRVRLGRTGRAVEQFELPLAVESAPIAFVGADGRSVSGGGQAPSAPGVWRHLFMKPSGATLKAVPVLSSPFWADYVPEIMRLRAGETVFEKKYDTEQLSWELGPSAAGEPWTGEVLLAPMRRGNNALAELQLRYPLLLAVNYVVSPLKVSAAALLAVVAAAGCGLWWAQGRRRRGLAAAVAVLSNPVTPAPEPVQTIVATGARQGARRGRRLASRLFE